MSVESVLAGWPSHLDLPAKEGDGTSWNHRVEAHGLSVELLDAMWYAAAVDHQNGYKQKCLRWIGPYFPGTTAQERKVQTVELVFGIENCSWKLNRIAATWRDV